MSSDDDELAKALAQACERARGHADFFDYPPDRDLAEMGVVESLAESLASDGAGFFTDIRLRGRPNDPPDCEALDISAQRIAIEVTELVSEDAIRVCKATGVHHWQWDRPTFLSQLTSLIVAKDPRHPKLKSGPYPGGYVVVVHTDEDCLSPEFVQTALEGQAFSVQHVTRAFLLLSYRSGRYPYFELRLRSAAGAEAGT